jgi:ribosome recycling factor
MLRLYCGLHRHLVLQRPSPPKLFSSTPYAAGKKAKKATETNDKPLVPESHEFDSSGLEKEFQTSLALFESKAKQVKLGNTNIDTYNTIEVKTRDGSTCSLNQLANIQNRGNRKVVITVFDPKDVKYIQTAILDKLNLPAQADQSNNQTLFVNLIGSQSAEAKQEMIKALKKEYEHIRNSPSKVSFTHIRTKFLTPLKKEHKNKELDDDSFSVYTKVIDGKFKEYSEKLGDQLKKYEAIILKGD